MTTSTIKVEFVVVSDMVKENLWLDRVACMFRQVVPNSAPIVYNDNAGDVALSKNPVYHNASKHIDV